VYSCSFIALLLIPITVIVIKKNTHIKQLLNNPHRFFSFRGFLASVLVGMVAYMIRYLVLNNSSMDLFDIVTNSYEGLIFYSGLAGFRYTIRGLLDSITFKMDANPGGGAANPNTGVGEPVQGTSSGSVPGEATNPRLALEADIKKIKNRLPMLREQVQEIARDKQDHLSLRSESEIGGELHI
jgi:uncharacterized membrane protein